MSGPQPPVDNDRDDTVDMIPAVQGALDYFSLVNHQGRPRLCKFDQRQNQWRFINEVDMQRMMQAAGGSSDLLRMLF